MQPFSGARKAHLFGDRDKVTQMAIIHLSPAMQQAKRLQQLAARSLRVQFSFIG
jgi:hypothetical protein